MMPGPRSSLEREQPGVVEIGGHDDAALPPSDVENLRIGDRRKPHRRRVHGLMPATLEVVDRLRRHRHVHQEPHPLNSMTSSSARLAA